MKKTANRIFSCLLAALLISAAAIPAFASSSPSTSELQKSVVLIEGSFTWESSNFIDLSFSKSWAGTGFAVGVPGEPVQHIGTCAHIAVPDDGVFKITAQGKNIVDVEMIDENAMYPQRGTDDYGNTVIIDHFSAKTDSLVAYYSVATSDYVTLSVIGKNVEHDVALCKIASEPTDKITARPLRKFSEVETGEEILAIGYPSTADYFNTEEKYDYSDSTVTKGIISKKQLTSGYRQSSTQFYTYLIDAQVAPGNSGGPLFDSKGNIVGINAFGASEYDSLSSANYAIVIDELIALLNASDVAYKLAEKSNVVLYICIGAGALAVIAAAVIIIVVAKKRKKASGSAAKNNAPSKCYLIGVKGYFAGRKFSIENKAVIGRDPSKCNVIFPNGTPGVGRVHCEVNISGNTLSLIDYSSTYGTFLANGSKVAPNTPVTLRSGTQFWVGDKENLFEVRY